MPELPGYGSVPPPSLRPNTDVASVPRLRGGDVGDAVARLGGTVEKVASDQIDAQQNLQYATARSTFMAQKTAIQSSFDNDQDWATMPGRFQKQVGDSMTSIAGTIQNPELRQRFMVESTPDAAGGLAEVTRLANGVQRDQTHATLLGTLDANLQTALANPLQAPAAIRNTSDAIGAARDAGAITAVEAQLRQQKFTEDYGKGYLTTMPAAQRLQILTGSATPPAAQPGAAAAPPTADDIPALERSGDAAVSPKGAVGRYQIMPDTARQYGASPQDMADPVKARAVADALLADLSKHYNGNRADVLAAYNWGQGNVDKWIAAGRDPAKMPAETRDYLSRGGADVAGPPNGLTVLPKTGTPADFVPLDVRAEMARQAATQVREDGALGRSQAIQGVNDAVAWLRSGGDPSKVAATPEGAQAAVGGPEGVEAAAALTDAQRYGAAVRLIQLAPQAQVDQILAGHIPTGPTGFRAQAGDLADLQHIAAERNTALKADAAGYVVNVDPGVQAAYQAYAGATDPQAQSAAFDTYVHKLNASYTALGLPADQRPIIPLNDAKGIISKIENGAPQDVAKLLEGLKGVAGRWWLPTYGALARAGLPAWVQAVSVASPQDQPTMIAALQHSGDKGFKAYTDLVPKEEITGVAGGLSPLDQSLADNTDLTSLKASMVAYGRGGAAVYEGTERAVRTTALYLMATQHMPSDQAATRAASMVTGQFDFMQQDNGPPARLPKGTLDSVTAAAAAHLAALKPGDVEPYRQIGDQQGNVVGSTADDRAQGALASAQHAWWMTITGPDGAPRLRAIDPATNAPVMLRGHVPLDIPVAGTPAPASMTVPPTSSPALPGKAVYHFDNAVRRGERGSGSPQAR